MEKYLWSQMTSQKLGRYAEHLVCTELLARNFDIYTVDVDDHGIDMIVRKRNSIFYEFQVKSNRNLNYIFFPKATFSPGNNLFAVIVPFFEGEVPQLYLIPSTTWLEPNSFFVSRDYGQEGQTSKPEWGLNFSTKHLPLLAPFAFDQIIQRLD
jgi:hypothetical protein